jgi:hypothetical protein
MSELAKISIWIKGKERNSEKNSSDMKKQVIIILLPGDQLLRL